MTRRYTESGVLRLEKELLRERRLTEASTALHTTLDLDLLLDMILKIACEGVEAERGTVFLLSQDGREIWSRVLQGDEHREIRLPLGRGIAGAVAGSGQTVRIADAYEDPRFDRSWDERSGFRTRSILCAPIRGRDGRRVGVFQLLNKAGGPFEPSDEVFLDALSVHAALALENAQLHRAALEKERQDREIRLVQDVQRAFQPERSERRAGCLELAGLNTLCEHASGDYYDCVERSDGRWGVVLGDVSGHGLHAALVMAQARAYLRAFSQVRSAPEAILGEINDFLARDLTAGAFMTMFLALADPGSGTLAWCNAGHPPALLRRARDGVVVPLGAQGRVLGVLPGAGYPAGEAQALAPGDLLLIYSDGASEAEAPSGERFGEARLVEFLARHGQGPPAAVLDALAAELLRWRAGAPTHDDLTAIVLRRTDRSGTP